MSCISIIRSGGGQGNASAAAPRFDRTRRTAIRLCLALLVTLSGCDDFVFFPALDGVPVIRPELVDENLSNGDQVDFEVSGGHPPYQVRIDPEIGQVTINGTQIVYTASDATGVVILRVTDDLGSRAEATMIIR